MNNQEEDENDDADDIELALEMMETSWSILDAYHEEMQQRRTVHNSEASNGIPTSTGHRNKNYDHWVLEQIPRVLTGMGDALAMLQRHADAVDAYLRALDHRQTALDDYLRTIQNRNDIGNGGVRTTAVATTATTSSTYRFDERCTITSSAIEVSSTGRGSHSTGGRRIISVWE